MTLGDLLATVPRKPRKVPPRTVKGQDIELYAEDGQRFHPDTVEHRDPPKPKPWWERLADKTPYGKAAKVLEGK